MSTMTFFFFAPSFFRFKKKTLNSREAGPQPLELPRDEAYLGDQPHPEGCGGRGRVGVAEAGHGVDEPAEKSGREGRKK